MDIRSVRTIGALSLILLVGAEMGLLDATHDSGRGADGDNQSLIVTHAEVPMYPVIAVAARISGTVVLRAVVKRGAVTSIDADGMPPAMLLDAATRNVRSWRFAPNAYGSFTVRFEYMLAKDETLVRENDEIQIKMPTLVRITAKPVKPMTLDE